MPQLTEPDPRMADLIGDMVQVTAGWLREQARRKNLPYPEGVLVLAVCRRPEENMYDVFCRGTSNPHVRGFLEAIGNAAWAWVRLFVEEGGTVEDGAESGR